jgi:hypothetical protein
MKTIATRYAITVGLAGVLALTSYERKLVTA